MSNPQVPARDTLEQSWIYALCMRCRVEYNTPSWEPPHWQRVCPFPLCPSYRQFANILSIFLIGEWRAQHNEVRRFAHAIRLCEARAVRTASQQQHTGRRRGVSAVCVCVCVP